MPFGGLEARKRSTHRCGSDPGTADCIEAALRDSSAGLAENGLIAMFPAERADRGDVYVKTGVLRGRAASLW